MVFGKRSSLGTGFFGKSFFWEEWIGKTVPLPYLLSDSAIQHQENLYATLKQW